MVKLNKNGGVLCSALFVIFSAIIFSLFWANGSVWVDETFSLELVQHSYWEIIEITASDVHPPLYYLLLKFAYDIICKFFPGINVVIALKTLGFLIYVTVTLFVAGQFKLELKENMYLWVFCICAFPLMFHYSYEIRMYCLAMVMVLLAYVFYEKTLRDESTPNYCLFIAASLGASYTHYYACVAVMPLFILLLIRNIVQGKSIKKWLKFTALTIALYMPWLVVLIGTMRRVKEDYHIPTLTWRTVCGYWKSIFNFGFSNKYIYYAVVIAFSLVLAYMCIKAFRYRKGCLLEDFLCNIAGIIMLAWVIFAGVFISLVFKPLFLTRYEVVALPCFWMSFNMLLAKERKPVKHTIVIVMIVLGLSGLFHNVQQEKAYKENLNSLLVSLEWQDDWAKNNKVITQYGDNAAVTITADSHLNRTLSYLLDCECYLWQNEEADLSQRVYSNIYSLYDEETISEWLESGYDIWVVGYDENGSLFNNIKLNCIGFFKLEDYEFYLYRCSL